jgi:chemotaxis protein methyltransferase CheR
MEDKYQWFIKKVLDRSGIDLSSYKRPQMERRINSLMRSQNVNNYEDYLQLLIRDGAHYHKFLDHITINVSEFFRNPSHWQVLQDKVLPELLSGKSSLKVWSAGCSTGEEPYTLAMVLLEKLAGRFNNIIATDIDRLAIEKAQKGAYSQKAIAGVPGSWLKKYFSQNNESYIIKEEVKKWVDFKQHDLLKDRYPNNCDLILCRNVVIYFTEEAKLRLYQGFQQALRPGGILFIGSTEQIFQARELGLKSIATFFYQKV